MNKSYQEKMKAWNEFAQSKRIPPNYRGVPTLLFMRIGKESAPLIFSGFWRIAGFLGLNYALMWGVFMYIMMWRRTEIPITYQVVSTLCAGLFFGVFMALMYRRHKRKHDLRTWEDFGKEWSA